jgi:hypothetical protein
MPDWRRPFDDPIPIPRGRQLVTLQDAGTFIKKLPKAEHDAPEWQAAMEALLLVVELGGPTMFARIGVVRALRGPMTVWIYVDTRYHVGHPNHIKAFADPEAAERWFKGARSRRRSIL